tara:strand:+ start:62 stop:214 length:153 start_codon:yes stop_codon:yes gene_type:complete
MNGAIDSCNKTNREIKYGEQEKQTALNSPWYYGVIPDKLEQNTTNFCIFV